MANDINQTGVSHRLLNAYRLTRYRPNCEDGMEHQQLGAKSKFICGADNYIVWPYQVEELCGAAAYVGRASDCSGWKRYHLVEITV